MSENDILDKAALELVHELLEATAKEGVRWFPIVRAKMEALVIALKDAQ